MDAANSRRAAERYEDEGVSFLRGIDRADALFKELGFRSIPSGILVDEQGVVRYAKFGGFDVRNKAILERLEELLADSSTPSAKNKKGEK